ncbi:hypothetical protein CANCADRAFT_32374 [Tortispora caseinolytica NRRL Y-17796]|uniref:DWNN domain-containing protein n=1 Tax=Tortispora caseinolytica NRRL Y-17796 TaxID=767744 RepID=A0A1E4TB52_9ASCO|nr:hypothetical protein CANCADRAFT_32374 [Tortispora caseinolytica NRRL Y-17796]
MSSSVYYRFRSQLEPSRVTFDGTGITVFEMKREIILANELGDGTQFELKLYNADTNQELDDDTTIIPRSSSVIAVRGPPVRPKHGTAVRYVSGSMKFFQKYSSKQNVETQPSASASSLPQLAAGTNEEDRINAMFSAQQEQWSQTQQHMAQSRPVYAPNQKYARPVPDGPPPEKYVCFRCGQKGHWIQACPLLNNPDLEGKVIRRTVGIPKSFLKTVEKPADDDNSKTVMLTETGEYVVAVPDKASWESYQEKVKASSASRIVPSDPSLICPLTGLLFEKPVKTPCCGTTYSLDAIEQALLDSDFVCPNCHKTEILLDQLTPDEETEKKVIEYKNNMGKNEPEDTSKTADSAGKKRPAETDNKQSKSQKTIKQESAPLPALPATNPFLMQHTMYLQAMAQQHENMQKQKKAEK